MSALSTLDATLPIDPSRPAWRSRCPKSHLVYCAPRSAWTTVPGSGRRRQRAISSALTTISVVIRSLIDQPLMRRLNASIRRAVDPSVSRAVLRDVAKPQPVRRVCAELPLHEVLVGRGVRLPAAPFAAVRDPHQPALPHEPGDAFPADVDAEPEPQLGEHPRHPVGLSRVGVDASDRGRQLGSRDGTRRR